MHQFIDLIKQDPAFIAIITALIAFFSFFGTSVSAWFQQRHNRKSLSPIANSLKRNDALNLSEFGQVQSPEKRFAEGYGVVSSY